jgi:hypothetical protein
VRACKLKWAFNAKADLVIHTGPQTAVCVEIKYHSKTSKYTMKCKNNFSMDQLELQQFILRDLLGYSTHFALLSLHSPTPKRLQSIPPHLGDVVHLTWLDVFKAVLGSEFPDQSSNNHSFAHRMVRHICSESSTRS